MLSANERREKLEDLLGRVQNNRSRLAEQRTSTARTGIDVLPPQAEAQPEVEAAPAPTPEPLVETASVPRPEEPVAASPKSAPVVEQPVPVAQEPATVQEVKQFTSIPTSSGAVAVAKGHSERAWTLSAVLERAWKLGSAK